VVVGENVLLFFSLLSYILCVRVRVNVRVRVRVRVRV